MQTVGVSKSLTRSATPRFISALESFAVACLGSPDSDAPIIGLVYIVLYFALFSIIGGAVGAVIAVLVEPLRGSGETPVAMISANPRQVMPSSAVTVPARLAVRAAVFTAIVSVFFSAGLLAMRALETNVWNLLMIVGSVAFTFGMHRGRVGWAIALCTLQGANVLYIALAVGPTLAWIALGALVVFLAGAVGTVALRNRRDGLRTAGATPLPRPRNQ